MVLTMLQPLAVESADSLTPEALTKRIMLVDLYLFSNWKKTQYVFSLRYEKEKIGKVEKYVPELLVGLVGKERQVSGKTLDELFQTMKLEPQLFNQFINDVSIYVLADIFEEDVQVVQKLINLSKAS